MTDTAPSGKPAAKRDWKRTLVLFILLPMSLVLALVKFLIAPLVVCQIARDAITKEINGRFDVGWASVGLRGVELTNVRLMDARGRVLARADRVEVTLDRPLWSGERPAIKTIRVIRPEAELTLDKKGQWDIQKVFAKREPPQKEVKVRTLERVYVEAGRVELATSFAKIVIHSLNGELAVEPRRVVLDKLEGRSLGGRVSAGGWFGTGGYSDWALQVNVGGASIAQMTRGTKLAKRRLEGRLDGFITLDRTGGSRPVGAGWFEIYDGRLYELPVFVTVLNLLSLRTPGETVIERVSANLRIRPDAMEIDDFFLVSKGPSFYGDGEIGFKGQTVDLTLVPRVLNIPDDFQILTRELLTVNDLLHRNFLVSVHVTGTWSKPRARVLPVALVTKPLVRILEWLTGGRF